MAARYRVDGRVALVTGAGQGIGRAIALQLAEAGARVVLVDRIAESLAAVERELAARGTPGVSCVLDVGNISAIEAAVDDVVALLGGLDIIVNNAGVRVHKRTLDHTADDWEHVFRINCTAPFEFCRAAARVMRDRGAGSIVNVASQMAVVTSPFRAAYCASKAAVVQMTRVMALDWAEYGIRVNAIGPGPTVTPFTEAAVDDGEMPVKTEQVPLQRMGRAQEIADGVVFLASDAASFVTGAFLVVDGGQSVQWM